MHLVIFGSGIIGTFTSYIALKQGYKVTLIEKNNLPASGATNQNGGQLSFSHMLSISNIKLVNSLLKTLYTKKSPITVNFLTALQNYQWCLNFIKNSFKNNLEYNSLFSLGDFSYQLFLELAAENHHLFALNKIGTVQLFHNKKSFYNTINQKELFSKFNIKYHIVPTSDIPSFCATPLNNANIYKAIYFPNDMCGDAKSFTLSLLKKLQRNKYFTFLNNQQPTNFTIKNKKIIKCTTKQLSDNNTYQTNEIIADHFILTPGTYIQDFRNQLKLNIPVMPLKGYSFNHTNIKINTSLIDHDHKIVYTPFNQYTRIAGLYDFTGFSSNIDPKRIKYLLNNVSRLFPNNDNNQHIVNIWSGLRPISMDRLPIIGRSTLYDNLYYNIAHGNLGWTLSAGSAKLVIDQILYSDIVNRKFNAFLPKRFGL